MSTCQTNSAENPVNFVPYEELTDITQIPGLQQLWEQTLGDPRICIAILDGPVDLAHPCLREAALTQIELDEVTDSAATDLSDHGTHVTSVVFGSHDGPVKGLAPNCRGLSIPIFRHNADGSLEPCSQERLAKAIRAAVRFGANVINISAGQFSSRGEASPELRAAIEECGEDVLIVSAAGNDGCDCLHVPGALPPVLAVGAMNAEGRPLEFSNWGAAYREHGVLAPGERILGASGDGGVRAQSGTSFSTPIVSGVAGLLLSLQQKLGIVPSSKSIRNAILGTTHGCDPQTENQCERVLAGRLSIGGSVSVVKQGVKLMENATNSPTPTDTSVAATAEQMPAAQPSVASVEASACCGGCAGTNNQFVYAIGELQYDFHSVLREASVQQHMAHLESAPGHVPQTRNSLDFLRHLFGYEEVLISKMKIGDIEKIKVLKDSDSGKRTLEVTVSYFGSHNITQEDVGHQIGFNGVSVGKGKPLRPSVLTSCNSMFIRKVEDLKESKQVITVETDRVDASGELTLSEAHYYVPVACCVTHVHRSNMYDAGAVIWKLNRGQMEVYGIVPDGNFAEAAYRELAEFHMNQCGLTKAGLNYYYYEKSGRLLPWEFGWDPRFNAKPASDPAELADGCDVPQAQLLVQERSERVALPGVLQGEVQLITGVRLPAIKPDMRGTSEWSQAAMLCMLLDAFRHSSGDDLDEDQQTMASDKIRTILERLDDLVRNPGLSPQDRALNHAATNLFAAIGKVAAELTGKQEGDKLKDYELENIVVKRSEIGYAGSDCWDVEVSFFNADTYQDSLLVVAQTIDVNDTIPALTDKPRKFRRR